METKVDSGILVTALETIQETQEEHTGILHTLEARPLVELAGLERRLEELTDSIERLATPTKAQRPRMRYPVLLLLTALLSAGAGIGWGMGGRVALKGTQSVITTPAAQAVVAPAKKGK